MLYNYVCPYCGMEVSPRSSNSVYAISRKLKGHQTRSYAHRRCVEAAMPKNKKKEVSENG